MATPNDMGYRLDISASAGATVRATADEQLAAALQSLGDGEAPPAEGIHDARKRIKKTRSLLRLARPALSGSAYRELGDQLRDAGRALSQARDDDALGPAIDDLAKHATGLVPAADFTALREHLATRRAAAQGAAQDGAQQLADARAALDRWPDGDTLSWKAIDSALARSYRRGRVAMRAVAGGSDDDEHRHDWRKRSKDLWYQLRLLRDAYPEVLGAEIDAAHSLADLLGDDHDLAVLSERLAADPVPAIADPALLDQAIERRRAALLHDALRLGDRIYAEKPAAFAARMRRYLRIARDEAARDARVP